jgi:hypothetical protein
MIAQITKWPILYRIVAIPQFELSASAPHLLLAPEDIFIKHPTSLWHKLMI